MVYYFFLAQSYYLGNTFYSCVLDLAIMCKNISSLHLLLFHVVLSQEALPSLQSVPLPRPLSVSFLLRLQDSRSPITWTSQKCSLSSPAELLAQNPFEKDPLS